MPVGLLLALVVAVLTAVAGAGLGPAAALAAAAPPGPDSPSSPVSSTVLYLPFIAGASSILEDSPIWVDDPTPDRPQVTLFRHRFALDHPVADAQLTILADTRYEVWFNGTWLGRGPARFSLARREYDLYSLGDLQAGYYVVAVLVQWAPNDRRSESLTPMLLGHIQGQGPGGRETISRTGPAWKAVASDAWQRNAALVHSWNLIGPTELLDLGQYPAGWTQPGFSDAGWPAAVPKSWALEVPFYRSASWLSFDHGSLPAVSRPAALLAGTASLSAAVYRPRSIPFLEEAPMSAALIQAGQLSPGRAMVELVPPLAEPVDVPFAAGEVTTLTLETLADVG
ncbi:MAG: hypothetical protein P8129_25165, partial [Anaerolineae bacterium]